MSYKTDLKWAKKEPLKLDQVAMLVSKAKEPIKSLIAFLYLTGARISEVVRVFKPSDMFPRLDSIDIRIKTEKNRREPFRVLVIPVNDPFLKIVLDYVKDREPSSPAWNFSRQYAYRAIKTCGLLIGRKDLHPHLLRHTRLTHLVIHANFNEFELMRWAGWSSIEPAYTYVKLYAKDSLPKLQTGMMEAYASIGLKPLVDV